MPLTPPQTQIFDSDARFRVAVCGRRFGKTYLSMWEIARAARFPNQRVIYLAPNFRQAKSIIWDTLKEELGKRNWIKKINESELSIRLINNSRIELRSAESAASIRGISADFCVLDEACFMDKDVWFQVIRPTLSDRLGKALFITTPQGQDWIYELYLDAKHQTDWESFQYTTLDGGQVLPEEIEAARRDLDERTFATEYLADFTSTTRRVFYAFDMEHNVKKLPVESNRVWIGADFNIEPMSAVIGVPYDDGFYIYDEIEMFNSNTHELCEEILRRYPEHNITVFPDPAGSARKTTSRGRSDHDIIREYGLAVKSHRAHPKVKDRNAVVNSMFCSASGDRRLWISPDCKKTIHSVSKHQYKPDTMVPDKDSGTDHLTDALSYVVEYNFPIHRTNTTDKPKRFPVF